MKKEMVGLQPVSVSEGMKGDPSDASRLTQGAHFEHHWCSMYSSVVVGKEKSTNTIIKLYTPSKHYCSDNPQIWLCSVFTVIRNIF